MKYDFDLEKMVKSKDAYRNKLAALPFEEKLQILEAMRNREMEIRRTLNHPCHKKLRK